MTDTKHGWSMYIIKKMQATKQISFSHFTCRKNISVNIYTLINDYQIFRI